MGKFYLLRMKFAASLLAAAAAQTYTESDISTFFGTLYGTGDYYTIVNYEEDDFDIGSFTYEAALDDGVFTSADDSNAGTLEYEWDVYAGDGAVLRVGSADSDLALTCTAAASDKGNTLTYVAFLSTFLDADYSDYRSACAFVLPDDAEPEESWEVTLAVTGTSGSWSVVVTLETEEEESWIWFMLESIFGLAMIAAIAVFL